MQVLVTGAAGFIGSHVCERLASLGHEVVGIDDLSTGSPANLDGIAVRLVEGSILDPEALADAASGADAIVHLAARPSVPRSIADPVASHEANATGTLRVLEAARTLDDPIVVVASSSSVYGANPTLPKREDLATQPLSPYAVSKLATEQYAMAWQHSYGMRTLAFRFFNVFGPRQAPGHAYAAVIPAFTHAALTGEPLTVHGDGTQSRDFTYVGTVTEVIVDAIERGVTCATPVNLAFGSRTNLLEVIDRLADLVGHPLERNHIDTRPGDVPHSQADNTLLRSLFPDVTPVPLDDGLSATVAWMRDYLAVRVSRMSGVGETVYSRSPDVVWRLGPDRVLIRRIVGKEEGIAVELQGELALVWIAADQAATEDEILARLAEVALKTDRVNILTLIDGGWIVSSRQDRRPIDQ